MSQESACTDISQIYGEGMKFCIETFAFLFGGLQIRSSSVGKIHVAIL